MTTKNSGAGQLFYRVGFDKKATGSDGAGGTTTDWEEQFTCRAAFFNAGGSEAVMAARLEGKTLMRVRVRSSAQAREITTDWRMTDKRSGDVWNIRDVDPVTEARAFILLRVEKGVAT
jgi:head-tail adaptor